MERPGDRQHGIADLPTQWGAAVGRLPAERTTKMAVVDGFPILTDDGLGEDEDQQVPGVALADVMGSNLPGDGEHAASGGVNGVEKSFFRHDGQKVHGSRQPGNFQCEAEKSSAVIFMGEAGQVQQRSTEGNAVFRIFHKYHLML